MTTNDAPLVYTCSECNTMYWEGIFSDLTTPPRSHLLATAQINHRKGCAKRSPLWDMSFWKPEFPLIPSSESKAKSGNKMRSGDDAERYRPLTYSRETVARMADFAADPCIAYTGPYVVLCKGCDQVIGLDKRSCTFHIGGFGRHRAGCAGCQRIMAEAQT